MRSLRLFSKIQKIALLFAILSFSGCTSQTTVPIETVRYNYSGVKKARMLLVFLPGRGDTIKTFQQEGIIEAVRERGWPADIIAVDAHLGYYLKGLFFRRMKEDVIDPAKAAGYEEIWMIGDSLGGFGSMCYAREYPNDVAGAVMLGPFPGEATLIKKIKEAGGPQNLKPNDIISNTEEGQVKLNLMWLRDHAREEKIGTDQDSRNGHRGVPSIYLGYGKDDRFTYGLDVLASLLPQDHVIVIEGDHDWKTWKKLWAMFLDKNIFKAKKDK